MNSFKHKSNFLTFLTIFLTSFLLGIIFSFTLAEKIGYQMLKSTDKWVISTILESKKDLELDRFWEVYNKIKSNSYNIWEVDKQTLVDWAIKWLVEGLWDKHSEYMDSEEKKQFEWLLRWDFEWIWALVEEHPLWVGIDRVFKWSPALKSWIKSRDIIIKANWHKLQWIDLYEAISYIKWPAWTKVVLEVLRQWESEILNITVTRDKITIPSVNSELLDNNIWYIALNMFWDDTVDEFKKALNTLNNSDGLIIDLRDNWGWYLYAATEILSELLEHNTSLVTVKYSNRIFNEEYKSINYWDTYNKPIVVLINENSASASEIVSWALHDHNKAILIWKKSYGKWSVQQPFDVSNNGLLKITIAKWFTPNDKNIDKEGIKPDIEIDFKKEDFENNYDRQLETAKDVLSNFIQSNSIDITLKNYSDLINKEEEDV
jgi:carboxyl-terminal processing protease